MNTKLPKNQWQKMYLIGSFVIVLCLLVALVVFFIGWNGWLNYVDDDPAIWFQRSGSLMIVILLFSDYQAYRLKSDLQELNMIPQEARKIKDYYKPIIKWLLYLSLSLTVISTLIWGYGDIAYRSLNN